MDELRRELDRLATAYLAGRQAVDYPGDHIWEDVTVPPTVEAPRGDAHEERNGKVAHEPAAPEPDRFDVAADDVATIHDLIREGAKVQWAWPSWLQCGVCNAIAARGGTGKTRFVADLLRRIVHGLPWPDNTPMTLPRDTLSLWVLADNHHDEMVTLARDFDIVDAIRINAAKSDPYGGVVLESIDDYLWLEARIKAVAPQFVVIDTVGNSTGLNLSKQEDAKAFYQPLQLMARRNRVTMLPLTHLNAAGQFLGRRVLEKVRVALRMEEYEGEDRRRLEVYKTNGKKPPPLGVTMGDHGNDYDDHPPEPPDREESGPRRAPGRVPVKTEAAVTWLKEWLKRGQAKVGYTISEGEKAGHSMQTLYRASGILKVVESVTEGRKWWVLPSDEPIPE